MHCVCVTFVSLGGMSFSNDSAYLGVVGTVDGTAGTEQGHSNAHVNFPF